MQPYPYRECDGIKDISFAEAAVVLLVKSYCCSLILKR